MYVAFPASDGGSIVVEVDEEDSGVVPAAIEPGEIARRATRSLDGAMGTVTHLITSVFAACRPLSSDLEEVTVTFGLKFSADLGTILAKAGGEANLSIAATWKRATGGDEDA